MLNRLELIKLAHQKTKARVRKNVARCFKKKRENGQCERCKNKAVLIVYEYNGMRMVTRNANRCVSHWRSQTLREEMNAAIQSNTTIHTVHPMVTLKRESNASVAS